MSGLKIYQLVHTLSYGDAISGEVLAIKRFFIEQGHESEVYALNVHPKLKGQALDAKDYQHDFNGTLILHYSLGSPLNDYYRLSEKANKVLIYHNLTPEKWFQGVNPRIVNDIKQGIEELPKLCSISDRIISDSEFNANEIKAYGFNSEVLNLPLDSRKWNIETNSGIQSLMQNTPGVHLLHVGRLAPNKCIEDIIKTFYFLHHSIREDSILWLVGIDIDTELYSFELKSLVEQLHLRDSVRFVGCLADSELKAMYENASVYMCMSEHEGFCLPLLEAMYFKLPVIAYSKGAVPDTMGNSGILVEDKKHAELAELVNILSEDQALRIQIIEAQNKRVKELSLENFEQSLSLLFNKEEQRKAV